MSSVKSTCFLVCGRCRETRYEILQWSLANNAVVCNGYSGTILHTYDKPETHQHASTTWSGEWRFYILIDDTDLAVFFKLRFNAEQVSLKMNEYFGLMLDN